MVVDHDFKYPQRKAGHTNLWKHFPFYSHFQRVNWEVLYCIPDGFLSRKPSGLFQGILNNELSEAVLSNYSKTGMLKRN